jgi:hypothetical protein
MRWGIWLCCVLATVVASPHPLRAQEVGDPPSPDEAMTAYRAVDGWVREWHVGKVAVFRDEDVKVPLCPAAMVTLRLGGEVIGRGIEVAANDAARVSIVAEATRAALADAEPKLGVPRDAMYEKTVKDLAKRMTVSVQLAGALIPISPKSAAEAMAMVAPGVEGVGARLGDRVAANFPERMLTTGTEPGPALGTLVGKLADDAALAVEPLSKLAKDKGVVFYRFRVVHLAQVKAGDTPVFLTRCGKLVSRGGIDGAGLRQWADELASHLIEAAPTVNLVVAATPGVLDPFRGVRDAESHLATGAVMATALAAYSSTVGTPKPAAERSLATAEALIAGLCSKFDGHPREAEPVAAALTQWALQSFHRAGGKSGNSMVWAVEDITREETWGSWIEAGRDKEGAMQNKFKPYQWPEGTWKSPGAGAIVAGMAVSHRAMKSDYDIPDAESVARESTKRVFLASAATLPTHMPWLGWAQVTLNPTGDIPAAVALREMRSQLWSHQLQPEALAPDQQDLAGGIVFSASKQPMPTWHMTRPLAFIATMLGDPRLTEDKEVPEELSRLLLSLRFLRQLTAGEAEGFMYKNPERAIGGVRSSLWDQRMPPEATAMTLMTVCETLRSLEEIQKRREKPPEPGR